MNIKGLMATQAATEMLRQIVRVGKKKLADGSEWTGADAKALYRGIELFIKAFDSIDEGTDALYEHLMKEKAEIERAENDSAKKKHALRVGDGEEKPDPAADDMPPEARVLESLLKDIFGDDTVKVRVVRL